MGNVVSTLAELKVIGAVETYYPRGGARARTKKGVERRGALIAGEYRRPLAALDTRYHGTAEGQTGPLVRPTIAILLSFPSMLTCITTW